MATDGKAKATSHEVSMPSEKHHFAIGRRGYDPAQVDAAFVESVTEAENLRARISELEEALTAASEAEEAVKMTFLAATRTKDEILDAAKEEADKLIADARYEAFKTLTDANEEAGKALDEAREEAERIVATTGEEADRTVSDARREAIQIITDIKEEGEALAEQSRTAASAVAETARRENWEVVQRLHELHAIAADTQTALEQTARNALDELAPLTSALAELLTDVQEQPPADEMPPGEAGTTVPADAEDAAVDPAKKSYYSRRSAKLPRIGDDASDDVRSSISSLRPAHPDDSDGEAEEQAAAQR